MSQNNITFNDRKINKSIFYRTKRLFNMDLIDVKPDGEKDSFKYIIGYDDNDYIVPLCIMLPQMI